MPHLNQLIEEYGKQGFEILCVTAENSSDGKKKTEAFIETTGLKAAVGYLSAGDNSKLMKAVGARGYPSSVLIDPKGKIAWTGHPSGVNSSVIKKHISGARKGSGGGGGGIAFEPELPKKFAAVAKGLAKGKVGANLTKIEKALQNGRTSEDEKTALTSARDEIRGYFTSAMDQVNTAKSESRYYDALMELELLSKHYKGHSLGNDAKTAHKEIKTDKALKNELDAGKRIAKALELIAAEKPDKAKKGLQLIVSGFLKDTKEAARAKKILEGL